MLVLDGLRHVFENRRGIARHVVTYIAELEERLRIESLTIERLQPEHDALMSGLAAEISRRSVCTAREVYHRLHEGYTAEEIDEAIAWAMGLGRRPLSAMPAPPRMRQPQEQQQGLPLGRKPEGEPWAPSRGRTVTTATASFSAAAQMKPDTTEAIRRMVLEAIREKPDTDKGISERLGIPENTTRPRRIELVNHGLVVEDGKAKNPSGRMATRWKVADEVKRPTPSAKSLRDGGSW